MSRILAIDLGKFKSVTCLLDTATNQTEFWSMSTDRQYLLAVLKKYAPELVVIESCSLAGWVHDECTAEGYQVLVCNPNQEAWKWKHVKRKTDRDDALKLAKLAALEQLVPVYIPGRHNGNIVGWSSIAKSSWDESTACRTTSARSSPSGAWR